MPVLLQYMADPSLGSPGQAIAKAGIAPRTAWGRGHTIAVTVSVNPFRSRIRRLRPSQARSPRARSQPSGVSTAGPSHDRAPAAPATGERSAPRRRRSGADRVLTAADLMEHPPLGGAPSFRPGRENDAKSLNQPEASVHPAEGYACRKLLGAIDQGTTSTRFIVIDEAGRDRRPRRSASTRQIYPRPGWVEHDAAEIWRNTQAVHRDGAGRGRLSPADLAAVGVTNQRETTVLWDAATGAPLHQRDRLDGYAHAGRRRPPRGARPGDLVCAQRPACRSRPISPR